jgi:AcrR family transcriptional regulator
MTVAPRRSQQERRETTIAKLIDATIACLIEHGYRDTSIGRICDRAGISHGGLFRHFSSRIELISAATFEIGRRNLAMLEQLTDGPKDKEELIEKMVLFCRREARSPMTCAWREVLVAARTNSELSDGIRPAIQTFEDAIMDFAAKLPDGPEDKRAFGTLLLSIIHMFDSEAVTTATLVSKEIEDMRHDWAVKLLQAAISD